MVSIIICSKFEDIAQELKNNIEETVGVAYEIIVIDNSKSQYSIFSAYNKGVSLSKYSYLCFVHEDVLFKTQNWGKALVEHLQDKKTGVIGVAGGKLMSRIPASWWTVGPGYKNIIQHYQKKKTITSEVVYNQSDVKKQVVVLDGVFLSLRTELFGKIKFDEELTGFHAYDHDISIQSINAGYENFVVFDILIEHFSEGSLNAQYYTNLISLYKKWYMFLPLFTPDIKDVISCDLPLIEKRMLDKFLRRMARTGFTTTEILSEIIFFGDVLSNNGVKVNLKNLRFKIFLTRLIKTPKYLFR